ncbi:ABC transporter substrate-binding protein [Streptomyces sp. ME19-01-6]|uniref:ABC transporter substrate-binding protein n=1 Tax=Streptomyces sp. ME19-01-6 TaxID=3028686 RepID=UPI0029B74EA0|nr:ABC transporter substrate-binding protein [Streptomyces sp. ME19-01-6]MDX3229681.1 ABC transporter substrate-binding protein [Streptomyces sp. ME19-01-6]
MNRKSLVLPVLAGLMTSTLAACGGTDGAGSDDGAIVVGSTDRIEASKVATAPLDPAQAYDFGSWSVLHSTFQTLMRLPRSGTDPIPDAAEQCGFQDRQSEQYRCKLREGLKFSNGHDLTSADVKFSLERVLRIKDQSGVWSLLSNVDKVETPNDREVVIHLATPDATFPSKLTTPAAAILDSEVYRKDAVHKGFDIVGSGPYTAKTEVQGNRLTKVVFTRNPQYQGDIQLRSDKVEMRFFDDAKTMEQALTKGDVDVVNRGFSPEQIERLDTGEVKGIQLQETSGQGIRYLVFDTSAPVVKNKAVRQAIAHIVDRQALVRDVYKRTAEPLYSMVPSNISSHTNSFHNEYGDPDVGAARDLLEQAGIDTPVRLTLTYTTDHYGPETAQEFKKLQAQLNASGLFSVRIKGVKWTEFRPAVPKREYAVYGMGWLPDFPDPDTYIAPFLTKDNWLNSAYHNKTVQDELIPRTRQESQRALAVKDLQRIQDIVASDVPYLPLWQGKQYVAAREGIVGSEYLLDSSTMLQLWELGRADDN